MDLKVVYIVQLVSGVGRASICETVFLLLDAAYIRQREAFHQHISTAKAQTILRLVLIFL